MVDQTHQVKSSLPTVKWCSRIGRQGDEENNPGCIRQQDEDSRQVRPSGGDADVPKHPKITDRPIACTTCLWTQSDRLDSVFKTDAAPTKPIRNRETSSRSQRESTSRERFVKEKEVTSTETGPASPISRPDYEKVDPHWEGHGFRRDRPRLLGQRRRQSTSLSKTDSSSSQSTSKRFAHRYSQSGHRQSDEKQELTHVRSPKWQVNPHNRIQRWIHRGARWQDRGPARGSGRRPFDSRPGRKSEKLEKSVDRGKIQNRHFEERKDTFKTVKFHVH